MRLRALVLLAASLLIGAPAAAQDATEQARAHFELGLRMVEQGRWSDAVRELEAARAIRPTAPVLYNLGIAYRAVGRVRDAIAVFGEFLEVLGAEGSRTRRAEVEGYIAELRTRLAHLRVRAAPPEARVEVDDREAGEAIELDPGTHRVRVSLQGHVTHEEEVSLQPGEQRTLDVELAPASTRLTIETRTPGAIVFLDGRELGAPPIDEEVSPGEHVVELRAPGHLALRRELVLSPGEALRLEPELTRESRSIVEEPWLWIGSGAALAVVIAIVVGVVAASGTEDPYVGNLGVVTGVLVGP